MRKIRRITAKQEDNTLIQELTIVSKGAVVGVIITLICIIIFSFIMQLSSLQESVIRPAGQVARILSIAIGGAFVARKSHNKGWLKGAVTGVFYVIILSVIGFMFGGSFAFDRILLSDTIMALIVGAIGGAIGINIR